MRHFFFLPGVQTGNAQCASQSSGGGEVSLDENAGRVSAENDGPIGNRHNPEQTLRARSPALAVVLGTLLLWILTVQEEPAKPGEQSSAAAIADFSGTWRITTNLRRTLPSGESLPPGQFQGVSRRTQIGAEVTGTVYLGTSMGRLSGHVEGRTFRFESRTRGGACLSELHGETTLSVSGNQTNGTFTGTDCNGVLHEATTVGIRISTGRLRRGMSYIEVLEEGEAQFLAGENQTAIKSFRRALKKADGPSYRIQIGLARSYNVAGSFKDGKAAAQDAFEIAVGPQEASEAYFELGIALLGRNSDRPGPLADAEEAFRQALDLSGGTLNKARYLLGQVLLKLERNPEGVALLEDFLRADPDSPIAPRVEALIQSAKNERIQ